MKKLQCPKCKSVNIISEDIYSIFSASNGLNLCCVGYCEDCKTSLQWDEVYKFYEYENVEESD